LRRRAAYRLCAARKYEVKPRTCLLFNFLNGCLPFYGWVRSDHVSLTWFVQVMEVVRQPHQFSTRQPLCYRSKPTSRLLANDERMPETAGSRWSLADIRIEGKLSRAHRLNWTVVSYGVLGDYPMSWRIVVRHRTHP